MMTQKNVHISITHHGSTNRLTPSISLVPSNFIFEIFSYPIWRPFSTCGCGGSNPTVLRHPLPLWQWKLYLELNCANGPTRYHTVAECGRQRNYSLVRPHTQWQEFVEGCHFLASFRVIKASYNYCCSHRNKPPASSFEVPLRLGALVVVSNWHTPPWSTARKEEPI